MARYYGFECELCGTIVALGQCGPNDREKVTFYAAPLDPVLCPDCGGSYLYSTDDLFEFVADENILQFPSKTKP
jgi:transcription initiation factor IIE alpha subunit